MLNIKEMEQKALKELKETQEKTINEMVKVFEDGFYEQLKEDVAINQKVSKEYYELEIPFNVKCSPGFATQRIPSNGLTPKEIMEKVSDVLIEKGYVTEFVENNINNEKSVLKARLNVQ